DPGDRLPLGVGGHVVNFHSWSHVLPVNPSQTSAPDHHHQYRLRFRIGGVVLEVFDHAKFGGVEHLRPVTLFASVARGNQAVAFHRRRDGTPVVVEHNAHQLTGAGGFALHPTRHAGTYVAVHARHIGVWRVLMRCKLGFHDVTALAAELDGLHVLHGAICALGSDHDVGGGRDNQEDGKLADICLPVGEGD